MDEAVRGRIECHIKPLIGRMSVAALTRDDVDRFMHDVAEGKTARNSKTKKRKVTKVRGGKGAATRTVGLLGAILSYAVRHGMRADSPVRGIVRFADGRRERRLNEKEYQALGKALQKAEEANVWPAAVAMARFLTLTGWRKGEALGLRWDEIDLARRTATLADTKTGRSIRPLSRAACDVLRGLTRSEGLVFAASRGDDRMTGFPRHWAQIAKLGKLPLDVTPHTLRHSFASLAGDLGFSEPTIGALVGHKGRTITSRYVHSADAVLLSAADAVADRALALQASSVRRLRLSRMTVPVTGIARPVRVPATPRPPKPTCSACSPRAACRVLTFWWAIRWVVCMPNTTPQSIRRRCPASFWRRRVQPISPVAARGCRTSPCVAHPAGLDGSCRGAHATNWQAWIRFWPRWLTWPRWRESRCWYCPGRTTGPKAVLTFSGPRHKTIWPAATPDQSIAWPPEGAITSMAINRAGSSRRSRRS